MGVGVGVGVVVGVGGVVSIGVAELARRSSMRGTVPASRRPRRRHSSRPAWPWTRMPSLGPFVLRKLAAGLPLSADVDADDDVRITTVDVSGRHLPVSPRAPTPQPTDPHTGPPPSH